MFLLRTSLAYNRKKHRMEEKEREKKKWRERGSEREEEKKVLTSPRQEEQIRFAVYRTAYTIRWRKEKVIRDLNNINM